MDYEYDDLSLWKPADLQSLYTRLCKFRPQDKGAFQLHKGLELDFAGPDEDSAFMRVRSEIVNMDIKVPMEQALSILKTMYVNVKTNLQDRRKYCLNMWKNACIHLQTTEQRLEAEKKAVSLLAESLSAITSVLTCKQMDWEMEEVD